MTDAFRAYKRDIELTKAITAEVASFKAEMAAWHAEHDED